MLDRDGPAEAERDAIELRQDRRSRFTSSSPACAGSPTRSAACAATRRSPGRPTPTGDASTSSPAAASSRSRAGAGSSPLDFVLASAASPGGFAPQLLDRSADADGYRGRGIENFPESGTLWYTDGGLLGSQPLGRVIAAGRSAARSRPRGDRTAPPADRPALRGRRWARRVERPRQPSRAGRSGLSRALGDPLRAEPVRRPAPDREGQLANRVGRAARRRRSDRT